MKSYFIVLILLLVACSSAADSSSPDSDAECLFDINSQAICSHSDIRVSMRFDKVANDESRLLSLEVTYRGKQHSLSITPDTTMLSGDKGVISFEDINYDSVPDIAVSTSFGVSNLYMDYWIYNNLKKKYLHIGNYSRFSLNPKNKTLTNTVKINAEKYEKNVYSWNGFKLTRKNK